MFTEFYKLDPDKKVERLESVSPENARPDQNSQKQILTEFITISEKLKDLDPEEINIKVNASLEMFAVCVCSPEKVITDVKIRGNLTVLQRGTTWVDFWKTSVL